MTRCRIINERGFDSLFCDIKTQHEHLFFVLVFTYLNMNIKLKKFCVERDFSLHNISKKGILFKYRERINNLSRGVQESIITNE
jgi:hypothetical protein